MKFLNTKPPIASADLATVDEILGFPLPQDLRDHYLQFNGGHPVPSLFPKDDELYSVHEFLPIKHGMRGESFEDTYRSVVIGNELFPRHLIPIASDGGGDYFCYSMKPTDVGTICFFQSDYYDDPERATVFLARNLKSFFASLISGR